MVDMEVHAETETVLVDLQTIRAIVAMINEICIPKGAFDDDQLEIAKQIATELEEAVIEATSPTPIAPWDDPDWEED